MISSSNVFKKLWRVEMLVCIAAFIGFADATYLTLVHYIGGIPPCFVLSGCEQVLTSTYASLLGFPISILGIVYYASILMLVGPTIHSRTHPPWPWVALLASIGALATSYFIYLQAFVLNTWCTYCLISATCSLIIFAGSLVAIMNLTETYD